MKHGDKTKGKASKASGKKNAGPAPKSSKASLQTKKQSSAAAKTGSSSTSSKSKGNGSHRSSGDVNFSNPLVASAFKRAVKKYPNAFRRLTD